MTVESQRLAGDVAIVTGGASGIGRGTCLKLARNGAIVYVVDVNDAMAAETVALVRAEGFEAHAVHMDVTDTDSVKRGFKAIHDQAGRITILVLGAVATGFTPIESCSDEEWERVIAVNLTGYFKCLREVHPYMKASGGGRIVLISSSSAKSGSTHGGPHYTASKGGEISLGKYAARRWVKDNIRVNNICPGIVDTPLGRHPDAGRPIEDFIHDIPMGRVADPEDMAGVIMFLVSDESRYVTGITVDVNGGRYVYGN